MLAEWLSAGPPSTSRCTARSNVRRLGEPWTFGLHPGAVGAFVARSGLRLCEDLGADDYRQRYLGAAMPGYRFYRIALARTEVPPAPVG